MKYNPKVFFLEYVKHDDITTTLRFRSKPTFDMWESSTSENENNCLQQLQNFFQNRGVDTWVINDLEKVLLGVHEVGVVDCDVSKICSCLITTLCVIGWNRFEVQKENPENSHELCKVPSFLL